MPEARGAKLGTMGTAAGMSRAINPFFDPEAKLDKMLLKYAHDILDKTPEDVKLRTMGPSGREPFSGHFLIDTFPSPTACPRKNVGKLLVPLQPLAKTLVGSAFAQQFEPCQSRYGDLGLLYCLRAANHRSQYPCTRAAAKHCREVRGCIEPNRSKKCSATH